MNRHLSKLLFACAMAWGGAVFAQAFPSRPVTFVVPFAAGGSADATTRALSQKLAEAWGQAVIVDNKPGGGTNIGTQYVAKQPADGYTVLFATDAMVVNTLLYRSLSFDPYRDFAPVSVIAHLDQVMLVPAALPANNMREFVAYAKANPGKLNYGSYGSGSPPHLAYELFKHITKTDIVHIPYKGVAPMVTDFMGGNLQTIVTGVYSALPLVKSGKARVLGIEGRRSPLLPDVPTFTEAGLPDMRAPAWWGYAVPAGTPPAIVAKLHRDIVAVVKDPEFRQRRLVEVGLEPVGNTPEEFTALMKDTAVLWAPIIKAANIRAD
jgi:tripartite-type tricarboxylate transporter receptor subunit TctC